MVQRVFFILLCFMSLAYQTRSQGIVLEGYTYETGNRGYLSQVNIIAIDLVTGQEFFNGTSDVSGHFKFDLPPLKSLKIIASKDVFKLHEQVIDLTDAGPEGKKFLKIEMERKSGYIFEITLANKRKTEGEVVDAIKGALIEVYNNTTEKEILKLENHQAPEFKVNLEKGNHYTILVRKEGYISKHMEAFVNVKGCILCFEGVSDVKPGISENLTSQNEYGVLLANVEMDIIEYGKGIQISNINYASGSSELNNAAKKELDKVLSIVRYNPHLYFELSSHTDSRGSEATNQHLSELRAKTALDYINSKTNLPSHRLVAIGYGESRLLNRCKDNIMCTENEHALNRRTEITILGKSMDEAHRSLVYIKNEEKIDQEIFSGNSEELTQEEYEKLMKADKGKQEKGNKESVKTTATDNSHSHKDHSSEESSQNKTTEFSSESKNQNAEIIAKVKLLESEPKQHSTEVLTELSVDESKNKVIASKSTTQDMPEDQVVPVDKTSISDGYYVVLYHSLKPLKKNNAIFSSSDDVIEYKTTKHYLYLTDKQSSEEEANKVLESKYITKYPGSYVVGFKGNSRIK